MTNKYLIIAIAILLVIIGVIARMVDHPPNFVPIAAIAIVSAFYFKSRYSWVLVVLAMLISDAFIGFYDMGVLLTVYATYLVIWGLGRWARASKTRFALVPATLLGAVLFFLSTNFAVWAFTPWYEKTAAGLYLCYAMAIPFFRWTLTGDVLYVFVFVAIIETASLAVRRKATAGRFLSQSFYN